MNLIFGTWKLDPKYGKVSSLNDAEKIILYSINQGIKSFDTANVYANGEIENILGKYADASLEVITKIPALHKLSFAEDGNAEQLYPNSWLEESVEKTTQRLKNENYTVILHNYSDKWRNMDEVIEKLLLLKKSGYVKNIGISIANSYEGEIKESILKKIDVVEAPLNGESLWIKDNISKMMNKRVLLRSILKESKTFEINEIKQKVYTASELSQNIILGMTKKEQVKNNIELFRREK